VRPSSRQLARRAAAVLALVAAVSSPLAAAASAASAAPRVTGSVLTYAFRSGLDQPVSREAVFLDGPHRLLVVGGFFGATRSPGASVETFDTASGHVQVEGTIDTSVADAAKVDLNGAELLLGGETLGRASSQLVASARVLRIVQGPSTHGRVVATPIGTLPAPRAGAGVTIFGTRAILAGGYAAQSSNLAAVLATSDGRHFSVVANLVQAVRYPAVIAFAGQVLVIGGEVVESGVPEPVNDVQAVTPGDRVSHIVARLPQPISGAVAWVVAGRLFVAGGDSSISITGSGVDTSDSIWVFNAHSREFSLAGYLSLPVSHAGTAVMGDDTFIVGGESQGNPVTTVQEVVPVR
jgi:hypothetical protein